MGFCDNYAPGTAEKELCLILQNLVDDEGYNLIRNANMKLSTVITGTENSDSIVVDGRALLVENEGNEDITVTVNGIGFKVRCGSITPGIVFIGDFTGLSVSGITSNGDYQIFVYK